MRALIVLSARSTAVAAVVVLSIGLAGGAIRLLPWLVAPAVPFGISAPFAEVLASAALEVALVVGLPVGAAVGTALFVDPATPNRVADGLGQWLNDQKIERLGDLIGALALPGDAPREAPYP